MKGYRPKEFLVVILPQFHFGHLKHLINQAKENPELPILKTSAKFVQTSAEVSRKVHVRSKTSTRTYPNKYALLVRAHFLVLSVCPQDLFRALPLFLPRL